MDGAAVERRHSAGIYVLLLVLFNTLGQWDYAAAACGHDSVHGMSLLELCDVSCESVQLV